MNIFDATRPLVGWATAAFVGVVGGTSLGGPAFADGHSERCFDKGTLTYVDCPQPAPPPATIVQPAVAPPPPLWTGPYAGVHAGYGWAGFDGAYNGDVRRLDYDDLDVDGPLIGAQLGYLHQFSNNVVFGAEGDFSWFFDAEDQASATGPSLLIGAAPVTATDAIDAELDWLASARLRGGYAFDRVLPYVTGGIALAGYEVGASTVNPTAASSGSRDETAVGGVFGGGLEYLATPNVVVRAEGLYYLFDDDHSLSGVTTSADPGDRAGLDDVIVGRVGLSYKF